jgi:hypothetical protein
MVGDGQVEQMRESGCVDGSRHGQWRREIESVIRLDDMGWSKHMTRDNNKMIPPRVSRLRLRIMEGVAFMVLISDATRWAHLTAAIKAEGQSTETGRMATRALWQPQKRALKLRHGLLLTKARMMTTSLVFQSWQQRYFWDCKVNYMIQGHCVTCPHTISSLLLIKKYLLALLL